jgi:hypothetical protein
MAADNPYLYINLTTGTKVELTDLDARMSTTWDIALKRSSLCINGGDSGPGNRKLATVPAVTIAEVTSGPATGYSNDDFATDGCMLVTLPVGEPRSAFGEWYEYDLQNNRVSPKREVYVVERPNGSRTALRIARTMATRCCRIEVRFVGSNGSSSPGYRESLGVISGRVPRGPALRSCRGCATCADRRSGVRGLRRRCARAPRDEWRRRA